MSCFRTTFGSYGVVSNGTISKDRHPKFEIVTFHQNLDPPHYFGPGDHHFDFEYRLPDKIPISTPGAVGRIEYTVTVHIRGANWNLLDIASVTETFEVRRPPAVNTAVTKSRTPKSSTESETSNTSVDEAIEQEQRFYFVLWNLDLLRRLRNIDVDDAAYSLPLILNVKVGGEIRTTDAGKMIEVTVEADNQSSVRVRSIVVQLIQFIRYTASRPFKGVKEVYHLVTEHRLKGVSAGCKEKYQSLLKLPDNGLTPSEDIETETVQLNYEIQVIRFFSFILIFVISFFQVRAKTNMFHEDDKVTVPIAIARMP